MGDTLLIAECIVAFVVFAWISGKITEHNTRKSIRDWEKRTGKRWGIYDESDYQ